MPAPIPPLIFTVIIILPLITFWIWMFQDMTNNDSLPGASKNTWTLAFVFGNVFAATFYYAIEIERVENARDAAKRQKYRRELAILAGGMFVALILAIAISFIHR